MSSGGRLPFNKFCDLYKDVLASNGLGPHLLRSLHQKLEREVYDAGDYFMLTEGENTSLKVVVSCEGGVETSDSNAVFLIDHAWTYRPQDARKQLCESPGLLPRIAEMLGYSIHGEVFSPDDDIVNIIMQKMWKYNQTYSIAHGTAEEKVPVWYIMDEFGSRIQHCDSPTVAVIPFFYQPMQISYSIMWPLIDLDYGDEITRDYANNEKDDLTRKCKLLPWQPGDMTNVPSHTDLFSDKKYEQRFKYSLESLPDIVHETLVEKKRLKIYMNHSIEMMTDVATFEIVEDMAEADVIFTTQHIKNFKKFSQDQPDVHLCQFPCEQILFCKDFFMDVAKRSTTNGTAPPWYPVTFDLQTELPQFVSYFQKEAQLNTHNNCWICKPWNLSRGIGIHISNNLNEIIRQRETAVPMIVSKYIENPVLFVYNDSEPPLKFDLRYIVLMKSMNPLKMHACEVFVARLSNKPFDLNQLDNVDQHITTVQYVEGKNILHDITHQDFIQRFEKQYEDFKWKNVNRHILKCLSEFMKSATCRPPPFGVGQYACSRAIYGFDVMLEWNIDEITGSRIMQPVVLECNFMPDITRLCSANPTFLDDILKFLFLDDERCPVDDVSDL